MDEVTENDEVTANKGRRTALGAAGLLAAGAVAGGILAGTLSANADNSSDSTTPSGAAPVAAYPGQPPAGMRGPGGPDAVHPGEELLTGDAAEKVTDAALDAVPGGTIIRVETNADGGGAYEAHMTRANGNPVTVLVNKDFEVVEVADGMGPGGPMPGAPGAPGTSGNTENSSNSA